MALETDAPAAGNPCETPGEAHAFDLVLTRTLRASPEQVWRAWTEAELLKRWFAPRPWSVPQASIDLCVGGAFRTTMRGPDGTEFPNAGVILEIVPTRRLVMTDALTPDWKPTGQPFMVSWVELTPNADGGTDYVATARHWTEASMKQHEAMGFHEGWGQCATQLDELARTL